MPRSRRPRRKAPTVLAPIPGPDSFANLSDPHHAHSQAATLLLIGSSLRGDLAAPHPTFAALGPTPAIGAKRIPEEDLQSLGFPAVRVSGERFRAAELRQLSGSRPIAKAARTAPARVSNAAEAFYKEPAPTTAAALLASCLRHPQQLVRVAAAASYLEIAVNPTPALRTLESGLGSRNLLVRDVAAYALARRPEEPEARESPSCEEKDLAPPSVAHQHDHPRHLGKRRELVAAAQWRLLELSAGERRPEPVRRARPLLLEWWLQRHGARAGGDRAT